jgi:hypothetical protein
VRRRDEFATVGGRATAVFELAGEYERGAEREKARRCMPARMAPRRSAVRLSIAQFVACKEKERASKERATNFASGNAVACGPTLLRLQSVWEFLAVSNVKRRRWGLSGHLQEVWIAREGDQSVAKPAVDFRNPSLTLY